MSDEQIVLAEGGTPKKRLRIALQHFEDQPLLNIRYYYEDKQGEMQPTKKGVSISRNRYLDLVETIEKHHDSIADYLDNGVINDDLSSWAHRTKHALANVGAVETIDFEVGPIPGRDVGEVNYQGGRAKIVLNSKHDYVNSLQEATNANLVVAKMLVALDLSSRLIADSESAEVQHAIERLRHEFSRQLRNLPSD